MNNKLNGRVLYVPRGHDKTEDLCILADCIASSNADLFSQDDCAILIAAGERVQVIPDILREICLAYVITKHARETAEGWVVEYRPYEPDETTLGAVLITAKTFKEGSLACRLPKAPGTPIRLSEQQVREIKYRLSIGEPATDRSVAPYRCRNRQAAGALIARVFKSTGPIVEQKHRATEAALAVQWFSGSDGRTVDGRRKSLILSNGCFSTARWIFCVSPVASAVPDAAPRFWRHRCRSSFSRSHLHSYRVTARMPHVEEPVVAQLRAVARVWHEVATLSRATCRTHCSQKRDFDR